MIDSKRSSVTSMGLLVGTSLVCLVGVTSVAQAQDVVPEEDSGRVEEIVVTAQKREQSVQDVPIAVTAISEASIEANRITSVQDLSGLAPNVIVRPTAGGSAIPSFSMRGLTSFGVVPGSDKQVSINLDGVYISATRGALFELPDIARIEVLRGPQGTLFGRNATAGAVSIVTKDPDASSARGSKRASVTSTRNGSASASTRRRSGRSVPM